MSFSLCTAPILEALNLDYLMYFKWFCLSRYLVKVYQSAADQPGMKLQDSVSYIGERDSGKSALCEDLKLQDLIQAYQHTARRLVVQQLYSLFFNIQVYIVFL